MSQLASQSIFGTLTKGGGLSAAFDGSAATVAYAESTSGHVGLSLAQPSRIDRVEVFSADNGFDASGLATPITIQLYGKQGSAPSHSSDGASLASLGFNDQNFTRAVTLESSDKTTKFDHVWIRIFTGVWCIVSDVRFFESKEEAHPPVELPIPEGSAIFGKSCDQGVLLTQGGLEIPQFRIKILLTEPRNALLIFHGNVSHVGAGSLASVAVGFSFRICYRSAEVYSGLSSSPFIEIANACNSGNIINRNPHHYGNCAISWPIRLPSGYHEISVIGSGHTDATSAQLVQMLVEGGKGLNCLTVAILA